MEIISRKDAHLQNLTRYFTGKECRNGHFAQRYVTTGSCSECLKRYTSSFRGQKKPVQDYRHKYAYLPYISESDLAALRELSQALLVMSGPPPLDTEAVHRQLYGEEVAKQMQRGQA